MRNLVFFKRTLRNKRKIAFLDYSILLPPHLSTLRSKQLIVYYLMKCKHNYKTWLNVMCVVQFIKTLLVHHFCCLKYFYFFTVVNIVFYQAQRGQRHIRSSKKIIGRADALFPPRFRRHWCRRQIVISLGCPIILVWTCKTDCLYQTIFLKKFYKIYVLVQVYQFGLFALLSLIRPKLVQLGGLSIQK